MFKIGALLLSLLLVVVATVFNDDKVFAAACGGSTITVARASTETFVIDAAASLDSAYVSYKINTGASESFDDLWVKVENFSDVTKLDLATNEDGLFHVGELGINTDAHIYIYLNGVETAVAQSYDLNLYEGHPSYGGTSNCTESVSHSEVDDVIKAAANKVTSVVSTAPYIGGTMTITVTGDTGVMSATTNSRRFSYTAASVDAWPADCYELFDTHVEMTGGNTISDDDGLVITDIDDGLIADNTHYVITYYLTATCSTATPTPVTPVNYISSGALNLKHTDTTTQSYAAIPPVPPAENRTLLSKSVSPGGSAAGGTATYTLTFTNTAPVAVSLDIIQDQLPSSPANATYIASSSLFGGSSVTEPNISGQQLTWTGNYTIPANNSSTLVYQATIPNTAGSYFNSAIAFVDSTQIDQTLDTSDNVPATVLYGVGDPNLAGSTKTVVDVNGGEVEPSDVLRYTVTINNSGSLNATGVDVTDTIDTDTENVTNVVVNALATDCGLNYADASTSTQLIVNNIEIDAGSSCAITFDVNVKAGTVDNTAILNTATIGSSDEGGIGGSPSSPPLSVQLTPNLVVTKTENDADNSVTPGQIVTYTVTIDNNGDTDAVGVDLIDTITGAASSVGNFTLTNCGTAYTNSSTGLSIDISNVDVAVATDCVITYDVTVDAGATNGQTIDNSADVGVADQGGNDPGAVAASTLTVGEPVTPALAVTKTENDADNIVTPGQTVTYTVTISNSGDGTGTTSFTDAIDTDLGAPSNYGYTNCGSPSESFIAPTLTISSLTITTANNCIVTFDVTVDSPSTEGATIPNSVDVAQAAEGGNDPAPANATTLTVDVTPTLSVTKVENDADNTVIRGQTIIYTVAISNSGDGIGTTSFTDVIDTDLGAPSNYGYTNCGSPSESFVAPTLTINSLRVTTSNDCVVTYDVVVGSPTTEGATIPNSVDVAQAAEGGNDPAPANAATLTYVSSDGVDSQTEANAPNTGDGNNDGLNDSQQPDVTSFVNPITDTYAVLENMNSCVNKNVSQVAVSSLIASDGEYLYPVGLMNFELICGTVGITATVVQYYYGEVDAGTLVARKFSVLTNEYRTIPGAVISRIIINGQPVIKMTYLITDGGEFDDDGLANGNIIDPAGPALVLGAVDSSPGAPNTGAKRQSPWLTTLFVLVGLGMVARGMRLSKERKSGKKT